MSSKRQRSRGSGSLYKRGGRGPWIAAWYTHDGRRLNASTRTTDKAVAEQILAKRVSDAALRRAGVIDARQGRYAEQNRKPLSEHFDDWVNSVEAGGCTAKYIDQLRVRAWRLVNGAERISDLTVSAVQIALDELRKAKGLSVETCNHHLTAAKQFSRWLKRDRRIEEDMIAFMQGQNAKPDRRYERRPLEAEELRRLIDAAERGPAVRSLSGAERAMLYRVAAGTGFRASELRSLTPSSFWLENDPPSVFLKAAHSKHRQDDLQPIRRDLADVLRPWLAGKPQTDPVWPGHWHKKAAAMIRDDLTAAGIPSEVEGSIVVVDFHSLRATFVTLLIKSGANVKAVQKLARHSDPKLTMNIYTKLGITDLAGELDKMPSMTDGEPERLRATGTHGETPCMLKRQQLGRETVRDGATACVEGATGSGITGGVKSLSETKQRETVRRGATRNDEGDRPAKTPKQRCIMVFASSESSGFGRLLT
ncbi:MAG: tyrosine-type recombinase/integrase [Planctomycetota bacterium]|nr:tyrosine-type recombinase/integrase [Planctomycetota bacterium]